MLLYVFARLSISRQVRVTVVLPFTLSIHSHIQYNMSELYIPKRHLDTLNKSLRIRIGQWPL